MRYSYIHMTSLCSRGISLVGYQYHILIMQFHIVISEAGFSLLRHHQSQLSDAKTVCKTKEMKQNAQNQSEMVLHGIITF